MWEKAEARMLRLGGAQKVTFSKQQHTVYISFYPDSV